MPNETDALVLLERLRPTTAFEGLKTGEHSVRPLTAGVDQTNTSWVVDEMVIVKKYRKVEAGQHPEVAAGLALLGLGAIPPLLGWVEGDLGVEAVVHRYVPDALDGWDWVRLDVDAFLDAGSSVDAATISASRLGVIARKIQSV